MRLLFFATERHRSASDRSIRLGTTLLSATCVTAIAAALCRVAREVATLRHLFKRGLVPARNEAGRFRVTRTYEREETSRHSAGVERAVGERDAYSSQTRRARDDDGVPRGPRDPRSPDRHVSCR